MTSNPTTVTVDQGADLTIRLTARDTDKKLIDLTGAKIWATVKNRLDDVTEVIRKRNVAAGGADAQALVIVPQTGTSKGKLEIYLVPADTTVLDTKASYVIDVYVDLPSGKRYRIMRRTPFVIDPAVTTNFN